MSHTYRSYSDVIRGVPQDSILDSPLFNIGICVMPLLNGSFDIASLADDNTPCISGPTEDLVKTELEISFKKLLKWFRESHTKSNSDKCHLLVISRNAVRINIESHVNSTKSQQKKSCLELKLIHSSCLKVMYLHSAKKLVKNYMLFQKFQTIWASKNGNTGPKTCLQRQESYP